MGDGCNGWMWYIVDEFWFYFVLVGITFLVFYLETRSKSLFIVYSIYGLLIGISPVYKMVMNTVCQNKSESFDDICKGALTHRVESCRVGVLSHICADSTLFCAEYVLCKVEFKKTQHRGILH